MNNLPLSRAHLCENDDYVDSKIISQDTLVQRQRIVSAGLETAGCTDGHDRWRLCTGSAGSIDTLSV